MNHIASIAFYFEGLFLASAFLAGACFASADGMARGDRHGESLETDLFFYAYVAQTLAFPFFFIAGAAVRRDGPARRSMLGRLSVGAAVASHVLWAAVFGALALT